uniref:hypothetical protein RF1 n=1 Tax=Laportea aestuans TaxID=1475415 RepID=UPI0020C8DE74|nr:hypothetical protein RF1 [Laportea aestuans]USG52797.1 hypothetical protein RF1 [Laportea aestuans]
MIFQSFILGNLVSLCMKIINSVVVVGLYYGFLTTFSIGPSYLFLLRARVMEEGTEKKVSATTGFITGQLMMFISIYYVPLHLALGRPHTITVLSLLYLLFHFFWNNHKHFFDYRSTNRNSMRNLSIQCVFLNNLIFQLFNHFILPSSMLVRLVNIYMFRCNNKMLFVTSSFVGWLIGHILFMKWVGLVLVWIQQNNFIRSNVLIRSNKYLVSELKNFMARIFSILLFITCVYYLGRIPSPILTKKLKETSERGESEEEEETDVEIETTSETKGTKQEQEGSNEEDPSLFSEEKEDLDKIDEREEIRVNGKERTKDEFLFKETRYKNRPVSETYYLNVDRNQENSKFEIFKEKKHLRGFQSKFQIATILFDYKQWNRPLRCIKTNQLENAITLKNEMSQYFFHTWQSAGKERISFTHPPSLSTFFEMIERKMFLFTIDKLDSNENELYNHWNYNNKEKRKNLNNKFISIVKTIDIIGGKKSLILDELESRKRLCKFFNNKKKKYLPEVYDPFLNGASRGQILKCFWLSIKDKISIQNYIERGWINKIYGIFLIIHNLKFQQEKKEFDRIDKKSLENQISFLLNLINEFDGKPTSNLKKNYLLPESKQVRINSEGRKKKFIFENVQIDPNKKKIRKQFIALKEIIKNVPRWSHKLVDHLEQAEEQYENLELLGKRPPVRSRKSKRVPIYNDDLEYNNTFNNPQDLNTDDADDIVVIRYSHQPDFRRDIITGSMRAQRRKTIICKASEANIHSPSFLERTEPSLSFEISELIKKNFENWLCKNTDFKIIDYTEKKTKESTKKKKANKKEEEKRREKRRIEIAEAWDSFVLAQVIRGLMLVTQSILRKYIILPSLIIVKNILRILLFQFPEWSEDLTDWRKEMHVKCTYNCVQLSEKEFPKNWLKDGIQIKILFPFRLKPWHKSKLRERYTYPLKNKEQKNDFFFLTVWGMETELPFGSPRKQRSFFEPIFKELKKKLQKLKKKCFKGLKERRIIFINVSKEKKHLRGFQSKLITRKRLICKQMQLVDLKEIYELNQNKKKKKWLRNKKKIHESSINIQSRKCITCALRKQKLQGLTTQTKIIVNETQKMLKDKKKEFISLHINISSNKISYDDKILESPKTILHRLKRINVRLIRKTNYFINLFLESIYKNIYKYINNISRLTLQFFFLKQQQKKWNNYSCFTNDITHPNYICNNETKHEKIYKTNKNITTVIYTITESLYNISNKSLHSFCDLSYLSQAYVFYKLSQNKVLNFFNLYNLRLSSVFQSNVTSLFLKNKIKNYFIGTHKTLHSELNYNKPHNFRKIHQCKNGLKGYYKNDLAEFITQENRNKVNQHSLVQNNHFNKFVSYEKNVKKQESYDFLSYNFIKSEDHKNSSISGISEQVNHNQYFFYNYDKSKCQFFNMLVDILVKNCLVENNIIHIKKNSTRQFFHWIFLNLCFRKKIEIGVCRNMDIDTNSSKYIKIRTNNYQKIAKINKKVRFFTTIHQNQRINPFNKKKKLFDWMRMNEEILNCYIFKLRLWVFPEFFILHNLYKNKPWTILMKLLLLNFNVNKSTAVKKKRNFFISILSLKKQKKSEKEFTIQTDFESTLLNYEKDITKNSGISKTKKEKKTKSYQNNIDAKLDFLLKRHFLFQLRWDGLLNKKIINNINVYCLLLRLLNPKEITIASIERGELSLDIFRIEENLTLTKLLKQTIILIEPVRLSIKSAEHFIMHQTMGISVIHKSNHTINQRFQQKGHTDKPNSDELIPEPQKITENQDKTYYDLFVPESILSPRRRREFRIRICFYSMNRNRIPLNAPFWNENQGKSQVLNKRKRETKIIKFFLWPNYRLEDFACMNRYWFDTNNGSRFGLLRIHMYPQFLN